MKQIIHLAPDGSAYLLIEVPTLPEKGQYKYANPPYQAQIWRDEIRYVPMDVKDFDPSPYEEYEGGKLPAGSWSIIGKGDTLTEEQAGPIVEEMNEYGFYLDYDLPKPEYFCTDKQESLESLITSHQMIPSQTIILKQL